MKRWLILLAWGFAACAWAQEPPPHGPAPDWVLPVSLAPTVPSAGAEAFRFELMESQLRIDEAGLHNYTRQRIRALSGPGLAALGSVAIAWDPSSQSITVHEVKLLRGDETIDVLGTQQFTVIRREQALEEARLDGTMTAVLNINDLRVGDVLEFSHTLTTRQQVLAGHDEFFFLAAPLVPVDRLYMRADWPADRPIRLRATPDWTAPEPVRRGDRFEVELDMNDVMPVTVPENAPARFQHVRQIHGSDHQSWAGVAAIFEPLYRTAATLEPGSPLKTEASRIRAEHPDQTAQAMAALRLVQDEVRYLALLMGEGGLTPMSADESWRRRLGDCKAKTAILLALLGELGIEARPVLVSTLDNALDQRLPTATMFNHVLVEATVDGRSLWLDGTRIGDRHADDVAAPAFGWGLPIYGDGELVRMQAPPLTRPVRVISIEIDASDGIYAPARVTGEQVLWSLNATEMQSYFSLAAPHQRDAMLRSVWSSLVSDMEIESVEHDYDPDQNRFTLRATGHLTMDWAGGRWEPPLTRINWSAGDARDPGPHEDAPMINRHPLYSRFETTVIMPDGGAGFSIGGADADLEALGYRHWRRSAFEEGVLRVERETLTLRPEFDEAERAAAETPLDRLSRNLVEVIPPRTYTPTFGDEDAWAAATPESVDDMVDRASVFVGQDLYDEALALLDQAHALEPDNANVIANQGVAHFYAGDLDRAAEAFDHAAALDPNEWAMLNGKGMLAIRRERYREATAWLTRALAQYPDDPDALGMRATAHAELGDEAAAVADVNRRIELRPEDPEAVLEGAGVLTLGGMKDAALALIEDLWNRSPEDEHIQMEVARSLAWLGEDVRALAIVDGLVASSPDEAFFRIWRGELRYLTGNIPGGDEDLAFGHAAAAESPQYFAMLCRAHAATGQGLELGVAACNADLERAISSPGSYGWRGLIALHRDDPASALEDYHRELARDVEIMGEVYDDPAHLYGQGLALTALGQTEAGARDMEEARRKFRLVDVPFRIYEERRSRP